MTALDEDLDLIFSRFGKILSCEVIRDKKTGDSLQYAFIEFENQKDCEQAYFKMQGVLIDDHRIHVDFSQSVSKAGPPVNHGSLHDFRSRNFQIRGGRQRTSNAPVGEGDSEALIAWRKRGTIEQWKAGKGEGMATGWSFTKMTYARRQSEMVISTHRLRRGKAEGVEVPDETADREASTRRTGGRT